MMIPRDGALIAFGTWMFITVQVLIQAGLRLRRRALKSEIETAELRLRVLQLEGHQERLYEGQGRLYEDLFKVLERLTHTLEDVSHRPGVTLSERISLEEMALELRELADGL